MDARFIRLIISKKSRYNLTPKGIQRKLQMQAPKDRGMERTLMGRAMPERANCNDANQLSRSNTNIQQTGPRLPTCCSLHL